MAGSLIASFSTFEFGKQLLRRDEPEGVLDHILHIVPVDGGAPSIVEEDSDPISENPSRTGSRREENERVSRY